MKQYHRAYVSIDMDAVEENIDNIYANLHKDCKMLLVVKADAYGHGAQIVARELDKDDKVWGFGVATLEEGVLLRKNGIKKPILVLGVVYPDQFIEMVEYDIRANIFTPEMAEMLVEATSKLNKKAYIHIKIDTGMSRLGATSKLDTINWIEELIHNDTIEVEGIFTHFSSADESDVSFTVKQYDKFTKLIQELQDRGIKIPLVHCSNSAGAIQFPEYAKDMVRVGIAMYGLYPSHDVVKEKCGLKPVMSLHSLVSNIRTINKGDAVSYGRTFIAQETMKIATVPIGYADGYPRALSNKGYVIINGVKASIVGKICMDQFMVDITGIDDVTFMNPVTLIGKDGDLEITVGELGDLADKFNYEFICGIGKRIPRNYIKSGEIIDQIDYFA